MTNKQTPLTSGSPKGSIECCTCEYYRCYVPGSGDFSTGDQCKNSEAWTRGSNAVSINYAVSDDCHVLNKDNNCKHYKLRLKKPLWEAFKRVISHGNSG